VDGTALLNHFFIRIAFLDSWKKIVPPDRLAEIFNEIEKRINTESGRTGFFNLTVPFVVIDAFKQGKP
jgi:hypothetical protein